MIPKEKALELVAKYQRILPLNLITMLDAKNCALVAVNEVKETLKEVCDEEILDILMIYWSKVQQEIENL